VFDAAIYVSKITEIPDDYYISGAARKILVVPRATLLIWILASTAMRKIHLPKSILLEWLGCRSHEQSIDPRQSPSTWRHAANDFYQVVPRAG
jgi:hypothetical protein